MLTTYETQQFANLLLLPFLIMGLSHILQPTMWRRFFLYLHGLGTTGVVLRTFTLELGPAVLLFSFHQVWTGLPIILTIYGNLLMTKIVISMLAPEIGLRSLGLANKGNVGFQVAGVILVALGGLCFYLY